MFRDSCESLNKRREASCAHSAEQIARSVPLSTCRRPDSSTSPITLAKMG
jgi:hypothetical protein